MSDDVKIVQLEVVRGALADAEEVRPPAPPEHGSGGSPPATSLPPGCPVEPLGILGDSVFYLDAKRQLIEVKARDHTRLKIRLMFGRGGSSYLRKHWPRKSAKGDVSGVEWDDVASSLMDAACAHPLWNSFERLRGAGAWAGEDGELILHTGDKVLVFPPDNPLSGMTQMVPGSYARHVYPGRPPGPRPDLDPTVPDDDGNPADELLDLVKTWSWMRLDVDPMILLGWIGAAMLGGALDWRPVTWITGGQGTGKSTLLKVLNLVFDGAVVSVSDATSAGLWQKLKFDTHPIMFDELEAEEDNRSSQRVVKLARQAASGGVVLRGGADHESSAFYARSCFLFSSILIPPLLSQDRSRIAIMELGPLGAGPPPDIDPKRLRVLGRGIRRRLVDGWERFPATLRAYRRALQAEGATARGADQFGTLLAAEDVLLRDAVPTDDEAKTRAMKVVPVGGEGGDGERDGDIFLNHLLSAVPDHHKSGTRRSVGELIHLAAGYDDNEAAGMTRKEANRMLGLSGLRVVFENKGEGFLHIANRHGGLDGIFARSLWGGRKGATNPWVQAARRLPGTERAVGCYFAGVTCRSTKVPLCLVAMDTGGKAMAPGFGDPGEDLDHSERI